MTAFQLASPVRSFPLGSQCLHVFDLHRSPPPARDELLELAYPVCAQVTQKMTKRWLRHYLDLEAELSLLGLLMTRKQAAVGVFSAHSVLAETPSGARHVLRSSAFSTVDDARLPTGLMASYHLWRAMRVRPRRPFLWFGSTVSPPAYCWLVWASGGRVCPSQWSLTSAELEGLRDALCQRFGLSQRPNASWLIEVPVEPDAAFRFEPGRNPNADFYMRLNPEMGHGSALLTMVDVDRAVIAGFLARMTAVPFAQFRRRTARGLARLRPTRLFGSSPSA